MVEQKFERFYKKSRGPDLIHEKFKGSGSGRLNINVPVSLKGELLNC
jgi:hypothetical protein